MTGRWTILLIDSDDVARPRLARQLGLYGGLAVTESSDSQRARTILRQAHVDAIVLATELTDVDGRMFCRLLRRDGVRNPIIIMGDAHHEADEILALDSGANDYVAKPTSIGVLLARLRAHLRQFERSEEASLPIGPYLLHLGTRSLVSPATGKKIRLTRLETGFLKHLYFAGGEAVARERVLVELWGYSAAATTHTIETHLWRLRRKIEPDPREPSIVITEVNGYRLGGSPPRVAA
jgi:DNA-binding response OmpR family regulator